MTNYEMNNTSTSSVRATKKLIPELRFPEFVKEGEWEVKKLGEIAENLDSKRVPITSNQREKGNVPYYGASGIIDYVKEYIYNENLLCISEDGANLIDRNYPIAFSISGKTWVNNHAHVLRFENSSTQQLVEKYINSINIEDFLTGMAQPKLNRGKLDIIPIPLPQKPKEQQKIASCLSSLDEVIATHSQKLEALKTHKKGLMQNLFPAASTGSATGKNVPNYRFLEFVNDGEWVEKRLDKVCEINPKVPQLPEQFVYIDLESVENGNLLQKKIINSKGAPSRAQRLLKENDVIFQSVRPYQMNNYYFKKDENFDFVASTGYAQLRSFESSMYLYQFIHTDRFVANVLEKCTGSNYPAINSSDLSQIFVQIPKPQEQQKIASCLSSLDVLIKAQADKIEVLKLHKKGLMQGLFPSITN